MTKRTTPGAILSGALLWALVATGCVDNDRSFVIQFVVPPTPSSDGCKYDYQGESSATFRASGLLDLGHPVFGGYPMYIMAAQAHNYLVNNAHEGSHRLNTMDIQLKRIQISYRWILGREVLEVNPAQYGAMLLLEDQVYETPISGVVGAAAEYDKPGKLLIAMEVIPPRVGGSLTSLQAEHTDSVVLGVRVRLIGDTLGGTRVETNEFIYPVYFCWGCLSVVCPDNSYPACVPGQDSLDLECEASS